MNPGQQMFHDFLMGLVDDERKAVAEDVLQTCIRMQDEGTFDRAALADAMPQLRALVREEALPRLEAAMQDFASKLGR